MRNIISMPLICLSDIDKNFFIHLPLSIFWGINTLDVLIWLISMWRPISYYTSTEVILERQIKFLAVMKISI